MPPCGGNWNMYTSRSSGQNALRTCPWSFLLITRYCFTLCKEWISLNSFLCIYYKNCHQANGDNRHLVPNVPIGLGRDIRDMPIACARTHPDANKHARHIPMYRPVHSAHANKYVSIPYAVYSTVCHQVRRMYCRHFSLFHMGMSLLKWWKMVCIKNAIRICPDEIYGYVVHVFPIWCSRAFSLEIHCRFEPYGNIFRVTVPLCGKFTDHRWFPSQRPVTRSFDVFFDVRLNKRLSKQSKRWWFETPSRSLWRHCDDIIYKYDKEIPGTTHLRTHLGSKLDNSTLLVTKQGKTPGENSGGKPGQYIAADVLALASPGHQQLWCLCWIN